MNTLQGRVALITGAGRGIGREHALLFAAEGAKVVVNDLGGNPDGTGADASAAQQVVDEIKAAGGEAVANHDDISSWEGAERLVRQAVDTFGDLHVVVNNAGILRDRMLPNMTEEEFDAVIKVHLKGHFCVSRFAAAYWRDQSKAGAQADRSIINTSSVSGLFGMPGQTNYGSAKTAIATFSIIANAELQRYGVRVNAIAPTARTRLTGGADDIDANDPMHPGNVSPFVAYLATERCPINGRIFLVWDGQVRLVQPFAAIDGIEKEGRWTVEELEKEAARLADVPLQLNNPFPGMIGGPARS